MGIKREKEVLDYLNKMSRDYISISELIDRIRNKEYKCELGELSKDKDWSRLVELIKANDLYSKIVEGSFLWGPRGYPGPGTRTSPGCAHTPYSTAVRDQPWETLLVLTPTSSGVRLEAFKGLQEQVQELLQ